MKARQILIGSAFGPETLKALTQAFDAAWDSIASQYEGAPQIEAARLALAQAVLSVATESNRDVEALKNAALQAMFK